MTGSIMFLILEIRLNIAFAILVIAQFVKNSGHQYIKIVKNNFAISQRLEKAKNHI